MKTELEEAAERLAEDEGYDTILGVGHIWIEGFEKGAQWQQEQDKNKYSEEEMKLFAEWLIKINFNYTSNISDIFLVWKEQFIKK
jgi:hypothetical protein